jgi:hypothetical protein
MGQHFICTPQCSAVQCSVPFTAQNCHKTRPCLAALDVNLHRVIAKSEENTENVGKIFTSGRK